MQLSFAFRKNCPMLIDTYEPALQKNIKLIDVRQPMFELHKECRSLVDNNNCRTLLDVWESLFELCRDCEGKHV